MISAVKLFASLSLLSAAFAHPLFASRDTCKPNFQGHFVSAYNQPSPDTVLEWTSANAEGAPITLLSRTMAEALLDAEFLIEFTGQPTNMHHIKLVADTERRLAATAGSSGQFTLQTATSDGSQDFSIDCGSCSPDGVEAQGCVVSHPSTNTCVTASAGADASLSPCDGSAWQIFDFAQASG